MYKYQTAKAKKILLCSMVVFLGWLKSSVSGFDLSEEIASKFQGFYNGGFSDVYISNVYSPNFSKDPFGDAISNIESKSMQLKIAGSQYIERLLAEKGCRLSQKKIWSILYYFVPSFRAELARSLKQELGDYDSKKYVLDESTIIDYCTEYYICEKSDSYTAWQIFRDETIKGKDLRGISASTPEDIKSSCQEFFQSNYKEGENNEQIKQNVQTVQLGADKYRNETTDDSPYDIMVDLGILSKLLYRDAEEPITPVFYSIPTFSNSKNSLRKGKNSSSSSFNSTVSSEEGEEGDEGEGGKNGEVSLGGNGSNQGGDNTPNYTKPLSNGNTNIEGSYDELIEGLNSLRLKDNNSKLNKNICEDKNSEPELEQETYDSDEYNKSAGSIATNTRAFSELSNEEYQEMITYMLNAVDKYSDLPKDKEKEIEEAAGDTSRYVSDETDSQLKKTANSIKKCWESCEGLRIDQKASCMLKCACGEIKSPIFDPGETPGLGPIFVIRFCAVPGVYTKFSLGGKRIHSIEEGLNEIYGALDKLSREGRLGKWTQQYEFLDSATKQMKIADSFAFTIDVEFVDISDNMPEVSEQYKKRKIETNNKNWEINYGISNPLNNPVTKNAYLCIGNQGETVSDYIGSVNADVNRSIVSQLNKKPEPLVDGIMNSDSYRYNVFASNLGRRMEQQGTLRIQTSEYISDLNSYAETLLLKRCETKKSKKS